jgi:hypothetical protein
VSACDAAVYYDSDVQKCISTVSTQQSCHQSYAADVVRACDAAMYYDSDVQKCLGQALPLGPRAAEMVQFCDRARPYDADALACLTTFLR